MVYGIIPIAFTLKKWVREDCYGKSSASDFYKLEEGVIRFYERNTGLDWMEAIVTPMATMISHANGSAANEVAECVTYHFDA